MTARAHAPPRQPPFRLRPSASPRGAAPARWPERGAGTADRCRGSDAGVWHQTGTGSHRTCRRTLPASHPRSAPPAHPPAAIARRHGHCRIHRRRRHAPDQRALPPVFFSCSGCERGATFPGAPTPPDDARRHSSRAAPESPCPTRLRADRPAQAQGPAPWRGARRPQWRTNAPPTHQHALRPPLHAGDTDPARDRNPACD